MTINSSLFKPLIGKKEASKQTAFSHNDLNRISEDRDEDCLQKAMEIAGENHFAIMPGRAIIRFEDGKAYAAHDKNALAQFEPDFDQSILLGYDKANSPRIATPAFIDSELLPENYKAIDYRSLYMQNILPKEQLGHLAQAASLHTWNSTHKFCGSCGGKTEPRAGGYQKTCPACERIFFPRTDPVVIMLAIDENNDRILLGRSHHFTQGMYSCLAGFVEPGETLEDAVRRETFEEAGIKIGRVCYSASQPWPMPHTLMIGFYAEATSTKITMDTKELEDCRWFSRDEASLLLPENQTSDLETPPAGAIAHVLIRNWINRTI